MCPRNTRGTIPSRTWKTGKHRRLGRIPDLLCRPPRARVKPERLQGSQLPAGFPVAAGWGEQLGGRGGFFRRKAEESLPGGAALSWMRCHIRVFLPPWPSCRSCSPDPPRALSGLSPCPVRKLGASHVSRKVLELRTPPEAIWTEEQQPGELLQLQLRGSSSGVRVRPHQRGCVEEATALIRGAVWLLERAGSAAPALEPRSRLGWKSLGIQR